MLQRSCTGAGLAIATFPSGTLSNLRSLTPYLLDGLFVAALISATVPPDTVRKYLRGGWTAYVFAALIAFPIYVCDGGEIPLTRALLAMGVGPGRAFCFILASVGTCVPTIAMATRIVGWRATIIYLVAWLVLAVGGGCGWGCCFESTRGLPCVNHQLMRNTAAILFTVVLAMFITPLRLPAASCILSNAPSHEACKSSCCANMTCCAVSKKNTGPASQPLLQSAAAKQQVVGLVAAAPVCSTVQLLALAPISYAGQPARAHSPPPLAATCIRLI